MPMEQLTHPVEFAAGPFAFETLIAELSSRFINLSAREVDSEIEDGLRRICEPLGIDFAILWQWASNVPGVIAPTHSHFANGSPPPPEPMSQVQFPWCRQQVLAGRMIVIASLDEFPAEAAVDRESCRLMGVQSTLCLPLLVGDEPPIGALGFNATTRRAWPVALVNRLQLMAQVFANALARKRRDLLLWQSEARLAAGSELAGLAYYEVNFADRTVFIDDRFRDACGIPPDREEGFAPLEVWMERLHPDDRERVLDLREQMHDGPLEKITLEYRYLHPTGGEKWFHHTVRTNRRDIDGRPAQSFGVLRDITERRRHEESLRESNAEILLLKDRLQAESDYLKTEIEAGRSNSGIVGKSPAIQRILRLAEQVAPTHSSVLIHGETGTGKELVAQMIHRDGPRRSHPMITLNCAALPSGLVESELFGRERGAFTGAMTRQIGRFELADRSTLFLDEIGELSLEVQAKLLRVLERGEFERLGNPRTLKADVRLIAATNRDLAEDVRQGRFREDLYYRLNVFRIRVPPLRERTEDIPLLVWAFVEEFSARMGKKITQVSRKTMEALQGHRWPGNVRELRNVIEHAAILATGDTLRVDLPDDALKAPAVAPPLALADAERELILRALESAAWRIKGAKGAAASLGLNPSTLYSRMKKLGIQLPGQR